MGLSRSSALASNSTSTFFSAWLTDSSRKPRVWEPVGWFLVRRKRWRMASSVWASGAGLATSLIRFSLLTELVQGDDLGLAFLRRGLVGLGLRGRRRSRSGLGLLRRRWRRLELQQELHRRI